MENKSTRQLIEAANRKCEMRWKVLAFNPDEDNKLVKEFKDFDCIDCAVAKKREYLEKNPTHIVEVISESINRKTEAGKEIKVGNQRFYTTNDNGIILVRKIAPYDDADYYYAVYDPQKVRLVFTQSGGKNKQASMVKYNDTAKQIEEIAKKLIELNKHIQPKMVHESKAQRNEDKEFTIKLVTPFGKAKVCSWKAASVNAAVKEFLDANPAYRENKKGAVIAESAQKNESLDKKHIDYLNGRLEHVFDIDGVAKELLGPVKDYMIKHNIKVADYLPYMPDETKRRIAYACRRQNRVPSNKYMKDDIFAGFWHGGKEKALLESAQKNEGFYKYIDDVPTEEIAKALKELGIKEPYATQKAKIADKLAKHFGLRRVPTPIEMVPVLNALPYFKDESSQKNEALDEKSLKDYLAKEHSRALKNIKNMAANDSSSFFKGYATALHEVQRKFGL